MTRQSKTSPPVHRCGRCCDITLIFSPTATSPPPALISKQVSSFLSQPSTTAWTAFEPDRLEAEVEAA